MLIQIELIHDQTHPAGVDAPAGRDHAGSAFYDEAHSGVLLRV